VDHEIDVLGEFESDDFQQVASSVGSDSEDLGWVGFGIEIDDGEGIVQGVEDDGVGDSVFATSGPMDLHISIS
jgi:hypothetical protein